MADDGPTTGLLGRWWFARRSTKAHLINDVDTDGLTVDLVAACGRRLTRARLEREWTTTYNSPLDKCLTCERTR